MASITNAKDEDLYGALIIADEHLSGRRALPTGNITMAVIRRRKVAIERELHKRGLLPQEEK